MNISAHFFINHVKAGITAVLLLTSSLAGAEVDEFVPFENFLAAVKKASYSQFQQHPLFRVESEEEFKRMQNHILNTYYLVEVIHSFILAGSGHIDCLNRATQPGLRRGDRFLPIAAHPKAIAIEGGPQEEKVNYVKPMLNADNIDNFGNRTACADGYIPMARIEMEDMFRYKSLAGFFNKYGYAGARAFPEAEQKQER